MARDIGNGHVVVPQLDDPRIHFDCAAMLGELEEWINQPIAVAGKVMKSQQVHG
jgi:hypothetical protein